MRRRDFIKGFAGSAIAWPLAARAQQPERVKQIGVLMTVGEGDPEMKAVIAPFQDALVALGWRQDRASINYRWAANDEGQLRTYAAELVGKSDVLLASGVPALEALRRQTRTMPIVFVQVSDPVKLGFVASLAHPGGNITGFVNFEHSIGGKWLEFLKDVAPTTNQIAVIFDPDNDSQTPYLEAIEAAAPSFGVQLTLAGVTNVADIERTIAAFAQRANGALVVVPNAVVIAHRDLIIANAARLRLPAIYPYRMFTTAGGLVSYGIDLADQYQRSAAYVDRILKDAKPYDLPIQLPTKFDLIINLKTAKSLGLTIPQPVVLLADEVIE
jgi:putative tryptophan/tyrosine transport system substrate-binding protein